jgi:hypothetical protein|tara:strand:+ start:954 stop:1133 length:180 start_codon:yes stop_codon:yes gene_type:complete
MTEAERRLLQLKIEELESQKEGKTWMERLELSDDIHNIKMKLNGVKPTDSQIDCIGCGS